MRSSVDYSRDDERRLSCFRSTERQVVAQWKRVGAASHATLRLSTGRDRVGDISPRSPRRVSSSLRSRRAWHTRCNYPRAFGGRSGPLGLPGLAGCSRRKVAVVSRPESSDGTVVWGQSTRSDTDRYAGGQPPGSLVGFGGQGHERREREGVPKVSGEKPEGVET